MKKDTWLLKGIVPTPLFVLVRFLYHSLNLFRLHCESKIPFKCFGSLSALCFQATFKSVKRYITALSTGMEHQNRRFTSSDLPILLLS